MSNCAKNMKSACFASFAFKSYDFAQILENFARTCVRVSVCFRSSGVLLSQEYFSMLLNIRPNTVNGFKMCFTSKHRNKTSCKHGCQEDDSLEHCMSCRAISLNIGDSWIVKLDIMFSTENEKNKVVLELILRKNIRNKIQSSSVLCYGFAIK